IVKSLERRYRETDSSQQRERIEEYMSFRACPSCKGARIKPEVLAVTVGERRAEAEGKGAGEAGSLGPRRRREAGEGGLNIHQFTQLSVARALEFLDALELTEVEQLIGARIIKEIRERLSFLDNVGGG